MNLNLHRSLALTVLGTGLALSAPGVPSLSASGAPVQPPRRVIVKLRAPLAQEARTHLEAFLREHGASRLAPLYPALASEGERARQVREKFSRRTQRQRERIAPPALSRTYVLDLAPSAGDLREALQRLKADPAVEFAEEDRVISVELVPNDPFFGSTGTWGQSYDDLWGIKSVKAPAAWDATTGNGITVAVVDTGLDRSHPDLAGRVWTNPGETAGNGIDDEGNGYIDDVNGWDFIGTSYTNPLPDAVPEDGHGHGTHVSGTIAAAGDNGIGVVGVAWGGRVMAVKGLDRSGYGLNSALANAIVYAADNGADVINNSWGGPGSSQVITDAVMYARSLGAVVVAAAGNDRADVAGFYPASLGEVVTVAATGPGDYTAGFSNWGARIDVAAPGVDVLSLRAAGTYLGSLVGTEYVRASGTSMAAPHVSGLAALILSAHPAFTVEQVRQALRASAVDVGQNGVDLDYGYGRVDAAAAVAIVDPLEVHIESPRDGVRLSAATPVTGLARGSSFARYVLDYGSGPTPSSWTVLAEGTAPVAGGTLGSFDPAMLPDGLYTIRLTAWDAAERAYGDRIQATVDYASISSPTPPVLPNLAITFKPGAVITVQGRATGPSFARFRLEWAQGMLADYGWSDAGITLAGDGAAPVPGGMLGTWDTAGLTAADHYVIRLVVENAGFTSESRTVVYLEPDLLGSAWPRWLPSGNQDGEGALPARGAGGQKQITLASPPWLSVSGSAVRRFTPQGTLVSEDPQPYLSWSQHAVGDLDGDGIDEMIVGLAYETRIYWGDGTTTDLDSPGTLVNHQYVMPLIEDVDGDGRPEVLTVANGRFEQDQAFVLVWKVAHQARVTQQIGPAFPLPLANFNTVLRSATVNRLLVADLDRDGAAELLVAEGSAFAQTTLRRFSLTGAPLPFASSPLPDYAQHLGIADLDRDGSPEIVGVFLGQSRRVEVLRSDGTLRPGWPVAITRGPSADFAVGDLDRDGRDEVVVAGGNILQVLRDDGSSLSAAWPRTEPSILTTFGAPRIADVTGDGIPELLVTRTITETLYATPPLTAGSEVAGEEASVMEPGVALTSQDGDGTRRRAQHAASPLAYPGLGWLDMRLLAFTASGETRRSWRLLGAGGKQPFGAANLTVADFDGDGLTDIAAAYALRDGTAYAGRLTEGVLTVLGTGFPWRPEDADWAATHRDAGNHAALTRIDVQAPQVSLAAPADGQVVTGAVGVVAEARDDVWVAGVQFFLDGAPLGDEDVSRPFALAWDSTQAAEGAHVLTARARDGAGRTATSAPVTVAVFRDLAGPTASIRRPLDGETLSGIVTVEIDASDDRGVVSVDLLVDGTPRGTTTGSPYTFVWDSSTIADGTHTLQARALDAAGNSGVAAPIQVEVANAAAYDPALRVPKCSLARAGCDTKGLVAGLGTYGEPNQPNTLHATCPDGLYFTGGSKVDRVRVQTLDGGPFREGSLVSVTASGNIYSTYGDYFDVFYAADAAQPAWVRVGTLKASLAGPQDVSMIYRLPAGGLQAVRVQFRYQSTAVPCADGYYKDRDDLAFAVLANTAPSANAGPDQTVELGSSVTLAGAGADPDGDALAYEWRDQGGQVLARTASVTVTPPLGDQTFTLTVRDGRGGVAVDETVVTARDTTAPEVTVTSPSGGEIPSGVPYLIQWAASDLGGLASFDVSFSTDGGASFTAVPGCTGIAGHGRSCTWVAPGPATSQGRVRVSARDAAGNAGSGTASYLSIEPSLTVSAPNTAVSWGVGSTRAITWTSNLGSAATLDIEVSRNGGSTWSSIATSVPNTGTFNWVVSGPATSSARIRVTWTAEPLVRDLSDVDFTIASPFITVTAPNTNVRWTVGSDRTITWNHNLGTGASVRIEVSRDGGSTWTVISSSVPNGATTGSSSWRVTGPTTSRARIRVAWTANAAINDRSNVNFSISR